MANTKIETKRKRDKEPSGYSLAYSEHRAERFRKILAALKRKTGIEAKITQVIDGALDAYLEKIK